MTDGVDDIDDPLDQSPAQTREWFFHRLRTKGLRVALNAAIDVCENPKAQASARATASGWLLRAAGVITKAEESIDKDPSTMTRAEMLEEYARLTREADAQKLDLRAADTAAPPAKQNVFD